MVSRHVYRCREDSGEDSLELLEYGRPGDGWGEDGSRAGYSRGRHSPPSQVIGLKLMLFASQATYCREEGQESVP